MQVETVPLHPYHQDMIDRRRRKMADPVQSVELRKSEVLLFANGEELLMIDYLAPLTDELADIVRVNKEGVPYLKCWYLANIIPEPVILGQQPQRGRDYHLDPPKKTRRKLGFRRTRQGIEHLIRGIDHVLKSEEKELAWLEIAEDWSQELGRFTINYSKRTATQDALRLKQRAAELTTQLGTKQRDPHKKRIREMISKGVEIIDEEGNVVQEESYLAAFSRRLAVGLASLKREAAVQAGMAKYTYIKGEVNSERQAIRGLLDRVKVDLDKLLIDPNFSVGEADKLLRTLSLDLLNVKVRPYVLGVRKAIEHWGFLPSPLPPGTKAKWLQIQRTAKRTHFLNRARETRNEDDKAAALKEVDKYATVVDFLSDGKLEEARQLIELTRDRIFKAILDKNRYISIEQLEEEAKKLGIEIDQKMRKSIKQGSHGGRARTVEIDGTAIRQARERKGLQPEQVAIGISPYYLSRIEGSERIRVGSWIAWGLAKTLKIPRKDLVLKPQT